MASSGNGSGSGSGDKRMMIRNQRAVSEKEDHKTNSEGTKISFGRLTLGKIIFGCAPRVVLPPQQPVLNATMEQVKRWGEDVSNDGLDAFYAN